VDSIAKILAQNLHARRRRAGITQAELAERTDLSTTTVQKIERCEAWVGLETVAKIAHALNCTEIDLFQAPPDAQNPLHARVLTKLRTLPDSSWPHVEALIDGLTAQNQAHLAAAKKPKADQSR
jgi:transcriptional regulator with XRE-family HTH domain